ncbi:hypothetical protein BDI_2295 [Parabacteroides distasonis ATCC 8503]|uniref:Uncharacterized protein n=1 Tax=Parabacteroides distasonis (strain ATCC 8503 / DSM 20701 / CIP 104284 / JCM 5825 / NCTC 11152) TaxID=435591 RepID=A6LEA7_PARD8|nr:hypothetical protein BDI_2295 [Parabacteroides distasonis ATCC 8503]EEU50276.1 hypothetical protein HMPREF0619_02918 [Parabacteroides sp. D13]
MPFLRDSFTSIKPCRIPASTSSLLIYSVSSVCASFCCARRRMASTALRIKVSSSAMILSWRNNSALSSNAVISLSFFCLWFSMANIRNRIS